jgi:hypothetical protein
MTKGRYQSEEDAKKKYEVISSHIPSVLGGSIVDWGSSEGFLTTMMAKRFPEYDIYSVDSEQQTWYDDPLDVQVEQAIRMDDGVCNISIARHHVSQALVTEFRDFCWHRSMFDVQLILNFLHHFKMHPGEWRNFVADFLLLSRVSFVQLPDINEAYSEIPNVANGGLINRDLLPGYYCFNSSYGLDNEFSLATMLEILLKERNIDAKVKKIGETDVRWKDGWKRDICMVEIDRKKENGAIRYFRNRMNFIYTAKMQTE